MKAFYQHLQKDSFYLVCRCDLNLVPQVEMQEILWRSQNDAYDKPRLLCDRNVQKETSKFSVLVLRSSIRQKNMPHTRIIPAT